jgi:predicted ATP-dependent endonuclease of OLD family
MLTDLEIHRFKGINTLKMTGFKRVNLLVGKNNCGKTTVLEALMLAFYPHHRMLFGLNLHRQISSENPNLWFSAFHKYLTDEPISIRVVRDNSEGKHVGLLIIKKEHEPVAALNFSRVSGLPEDVEQYKSPYQDGLGFHYSYSLNDEPARSMSTVVFPNGATQGSEVIRQKFSVGYLPAGLPLSQVVVQEFGDLMKQRREPFLYAVLKKLEPEFKQLFVADGLLYAEVGEERYPVNQMGDGFFKTIVIILSIFQAENGVLLIDELENGLHYSSLDILWTAIFEASKTFNTQIIATTHSQECIASFARAAEVERDDRRVFRLTKKKTETWVTPYNQETVQAAFEAELEVR